MPDSEKGDLEEILAELMTARPSKEEFTDAAGFDSASYSSALNDWMDGYTTLTSAMKGQSNFENGLFELPDGQLIPLEDLDETERNAVNQYNSQLYNTAMAKFGLEEFSRQRQGVADENSNRMAAFNAKADRLGLEMGYDELELSRAGQDLDRWLKGQDVAQEDAANIADAKKAVGMYGTSGGKKSFSGNDLGAGLAAFSRQAGVSADTPFLNYPGTQVLDPVADRLASLAGMGIDNAPPVTPALGSSRSMIPDIPELLSYPTYGGGSGMPVAPQMLQPPVIPEPGPWVNEFSTGGGVRGTEDIDTITTAAGLPPWRATHGKKLGW